MRGSRRRILLIAVALLAVGVPATVAAVTFSVGSSTADSDKAKANQDSNADGGKELKCPRGYYVYGLDVLPANWGTYPSITWIQLWCRSPSGAVSTPDFGEFSGGISFPEVSYDWCHGDPGALTGLKVAHDRYIKDFQVRCGEVIERSGSVRIDNHGYSGDWLLDRAQSNDTKTNLVCDPTNGVNDKVVTGVRLRYREDSNEKAFTLVQLFCARVS